MYSLSSPPESGFSDKQIREKAHDLFLHYLDRDLDELADLMWAQCWDTSTDMIKILRAKALQNAEEELERETREDVL